MPASIYLFYFYKTDREYEMQLCEVSVSASSMHLCESYLGFLPTPTLQPKLVGGK